MSKKREGVLFGIQDGIDIIHNIFIEILDFAKTKDDHEKLIFEMDEVLMGIFSDKEIELLPIFDLERLEGKFAYPKPQILPIELFYDSNSEFNKDLFEKITVSIKEGRSQYLPTLTPGAVTRGRDFFNQEKFISELWESLKDKHIILIAPRRFGKTSILYYLLDHPENGFIPVHIDLEGVSDAAWFVVEVMMAYNRWIMKAFEGKSEQELNAKKKELYSSIEADWQEGWKEFCNKLAYKVLFLFDEFTVMLENITDKTEACKLLDTLYQTISKMTNTRCIITGSTMIKRVIDRLDYENKDIFYSLFEEKRLPVLSYEDGYEFTQLLLAEIKARPTKEIIETILTLIGSPIPFFIQLFVLEIEKGLLRDDKEPTPEDIKQVYQERLLSTECKPYFRHYYDHLARYQLGFVHPLPGLKDIFEELTRGERTQDELEPIFKQRCPRASDDDFDRLIEYLEDEFYIKKIKDKYTFTSNLIRDWRLRHSKYLEISNGKGTF